MKKNIKLKAILSISICLVILVFSATATTLKEQTINNQINETLDTQMLIKRINSKNNWIEQQKLTASNAASEDLFREDVSIDGNWIFVGAAGPGDDVPYIGSVYTYIKEGSTWIEQQELTASDGAENDYFGYRIAIDGDFAIITAFGDDTQTGAAYVFTRSGSTWTQQQKLTASDATIGYNFGVSVDLDGETAIIGSNWADHTGAAYVFTRSGTTWTQQQKITPSGAAAEDQIGKQVSISGDTVLTTAEWDDDDGDKSGSAYVFTRSGSTWTQQQKLTASDAAQMDYFGYSCDVDGDTVFIGAHGDDDYGTFSGSAYVFTRSGTTWTQQQKLNPSDGDSWDYFGNDISLDGDTAIIGADHKENAGYDTAGSAYVFTRSGTTWTQEAKLVPSDVIDSYDYFGKKVSLDGNTAIIGKPYDDDVGQAAGSAYVFEGPEPQPPEPDLKCIGSLSWSKVSPGSTQIGSFTVENIGESGSLLNWEIESYPDWGSWSFNPESGIDLLAGDSIDVEVEVITPDEIETEFTGEVVLVNSEDLNDICTVDVSLITPKGHMQSYQQIIMRFLENYPNILPIMQRLLGQ